MQLTYVVKDNKYQNINQILIQEFNISSRLLHKLIINKHVLLNGAIIDTRNTISINDIITIDLDFEEKSKNIIPVEMNLNIIYEDEAFLILNKPSGLAIHPSASHYKDSLANGVKFYFEKNGLHRKIRPINRLDFNTSGIVIFAKNEYVQECMIKQMASHDFKKEYLALVTGKFEKKQGTINLPIARKSDSIIERCVSENGKIAITDYEVMQEFENYSLVKCSLQTGRTHQIRVHFSYIGHPLLGDTLYGTSSPLFGGQALHSYKVSFIHPIFKKQMQFTCEFDTFLKILKK